MGNLYGRKYKDLYDKDFLTGKPMKLRNKGKAFLFKTNKYLYKYLNKWMAFLSRQEKALYFILFLLFRRLYKPTFSYWNGT